MKIYGDIILNDGIAIGANSVVNKSFKEGNIAIAGARAKKIADIDIKEIVIPSTEIIRRNLNKNDEWAGLPAKEIARKMQKINKSNTN